MSDKRLYIIGNGFDLYHGVKSRYSDFKDFVEKNNNDLLDALEEYFNTDELWAEFEETLAFLNIDKIEDDATVFLISYSADDWRDTYHHDYQYEIQRAIDVVTVDLKENFTKWILQLEIPLRTKLKLPYNSKYLTFNYTDTLERVYKIPRQNILYIHNKAINDKSTLILGHCRQTKYTNSLNNTQDLKALDVRVIEGREILDNYFKETYKDTETIISENQVFFANLKKIEEIYVLGHSISSVDIKYFQTIVNIVSENTIWKVTYLDAAEKKKHLKTLTSLGIKEKNIDILEWTKIN